MVSLTLHTCVDSWFARSIERFGVAVGQADQNACKFCCSKLVGDLRTLLLCACFSRGACDSNGARRHLFCNNFFEHLTELERDAPFGASCKLAARIFGIACGIKDEMKTMRTREKYKRYCDPPIRHVIPVVSCAVKKVHRGSLKLFLIAMATAFG